MKINIPIPCHENWENMTSQDKGRFCGSCQKVVIDFTKMSNDEIIDYFKKQETQKSTCGRFYDVQLRQINQETNSQDITKDFFLKKLLQKTAFWASTFLFFWGNAPQKAFAQGHVIKRGSNNGKIIVQQVQQTQQTYSEKNISTKKPNIVTENELRGIEEQWKNAKKTETIEMFTLTGMVTDELTKEELTEAVVTIKGTNQGTVTNSKGYFTLENIKRNDTLVFSYAGYKTMEQKMEEIYENYETNFILTPDTVEGYVVTYRPNIFLRTWRGIKSIFRRKKN